jgi:hypothetical protein
VWLFGVIVGALLFGGPFLQRTPPRWSSNQWDQHSGSPHDAHDQQALMSPDGGVPETLAQTALQGMKMPDKPKPGWMVAPKGTKNGDSCRELAGQPSVVFNGTCWEGYANTNRTPENPSAVCTTDLYDPPPGTTDYHKDHCFLPLKNSGRSSDNGK